MRKVLVITGSVGSGKTTVSKKLNEKIENSKVINLNEISKDFKIEYDKESQTYDFDLEKCLSFVEKQIKKEKDKTLIIESHFSHLIKSNFIDLCVILKRDQKKLIDEYKKRSYPKKKCDENILCENMDLFFLEAKENGIEKIIVVENENLEKTIEKILKKLFKF